MGFMTTADMVWAEELAGTLLRQLRIKFDTVPADMVAKVNGGSIRDLETWMDRVVTADTLDQVFGLAEMPQRPPGSKLGTLPPDIVAKVNAGSLSELRTWLDRVVTAETLDEVFAPGPVGRDGTSEPERQ